MEMKEKQPSADCLYKAILHPQFIRGATTQELARVWNCALLSDCPCTKECRQMTRDAIERLSQSN